MNIEKISEKNFIYAVNYETIVESLAIDESSILSLFDSISASVSLFEPLIVHLDLYSKVFNISSSVLIDTYLSVKKAFLSLKTNEYVITMSDEWYPSHFLQLTSPPPFLYLKGDVELLKESLVAFTGSIAPSLSGTEITKKCVKELVEDNKIIVSGLNKGIEGITLLSALAQRGKVIALLSSPLHLPSFPEHASLQIYIGENGLLVSPFAPTRRHKRWYPSIVRDLLSSLASVLVIPEERDGGGGVKCAILALNAHKIVAISEQTLLDRSLLWPRKVSKSRFLRTFDKSSSLLSIMEMNENKSNKEINFSPQMSLFD